MKTGKIARIYAAALVAAALLIGCSAGGPAAEQPTPEPSQERQMLTSQFVASPRVQEPDAAAQLYDWLAANCGVDEGSEEFDQEKALRTFAAFLSADDGEALMVERRAPGDYYGGKLSYGGESAMVSLELYWRDEAGISFCDLYEILDDGTVVFGGEGLIDTPEVYSLGNFGDFTLIARGERVACPLGLDWCDVAYYSTGLYYRDNATGEETCIIAPQVLVDYGWADFDESSVTIVYTMGEPHSDVSYLVSGRLDLHTLQFTELLRQQQPV